MRRGVKGAEPLSDEAVKELWAQFIESRSAALRAAAHRVLSGARARGRREVLSACGRITPCRFRTICSTRGSGCVEAIDGFDPTREASFETYSSYRIRGAILNGLARESEVAAQRTFWRTRLEERVEQLGPPQSLDAERELEELTRMLEGLASSYFSTSGTTSWTTRLIRIRTPRRSSPSCARPSRSCRRASGS